MRFSKNLSYHQRQNLPLLTELELTARRNFSYLHQCVYNFGNNLTVAFQGLLSLKILCDQVIANTYNSMLLQQVNILKKGFLNKIAEKNQMLLFLLLHLSRYVTVSDL